VKCPVYIHIYIYIYRDAHVNRDKASDHTQSPHQIPTTRQSAPEEMWVFFFRKPISSQQKTRLSCTCMPRRGCQSLVCEMRLEGADTLLRYSCVCRIWKALLGIALGLLKGLRNNCEVPFPVSYILIKICVRLASYVRCA
jgi:hypothetical protein